jgi:hypothetical protein
MVKSISNAYKPFHMREKNTPKKHEKEKEGHQKINEGALGLPQ